MPLCCSGLDGAEEGCIELEAGVGGRKGDSNDYNEDVSHCCSSSVKPNGDDSAVSS